jgi:UDP-N-acetylglucosamine:LPS N-acetylglucosamine transferase
MEKIGFFNTHIKLPVTDYEAKDQSKVKTLNQIENYLSPFGTRVVLNKDKEVTGFEMSATDRKKDQPLWMTSLKIISYMTIIFPLIVSIVRIGLLHSLGFKVQLFPSRNHALEVKLAEALDDIDQARRLVRAYEKHIEPSLWFNDRKIFEKCLVRYAYGLGSDSFDNGCMFGDLHWFNKKRFIDDKKFKTKFDNFIQEIKKSEPLPPKNANVDASTASMTAKVKRVAVLYTGSGGGGHKAPADAIKKSLSEKGYKVVMIDTDTIAEAFEPKVEELGYEDIWTEKYQRAEDPKAAIALWKEHAKLYHHECRRTNQLVLQQLRDFDPSLIMAVAHHKPKLAHLAYRLNTPMVYVHTDNQFCPPLADIARDHVGDPSKGLIKFTKPETVDDDDFFVTLAPEYQCPYIANIRELITPYASFASPYSGSRRDSFSCTFKNGRLVVEIPVPTSPYSGKTQLFKFDVITRIRDRLMVPLQIPARPSFQSITPQEQQGLKQKLGIREDAKVCMVMMGNNGVEAKAKAIFEKLLKEKAQAAQPLHVIFICGKNDSLKSYLDDRISELNGSNITATAEGYLTEVPMSERAKVADVWIAKMGGSTSAEALQMKKQVLSVSINGHPWEDKNAETNAKLGLSTKFDENQSVVGQILTASAKRCDPKLVVPNWEDQLAAMLASVV